MNDKNSKTSVLKAALKRYHDAEGGTFTNTNDLLPQQSVAEMLADAIQAVLDIAVAVDDVMIPWLEREFEGVTWLKFRYGHDDKDPWKWPKVVTYGGKVFKWMSFNSDLMDVHYKETTKESLARAGG